MATPLCQLKKKSGVWYRTILLVALRGGTFCRRRLVAREINKGSSERTNREARASLFKMQKRNY